MTQTIRTLAQVLGELADNTSRLISPEDVRDEAVSSWGALYAFDPGFTDDNTNQAGNGFFDGGSRWFNLLTKSVWICFDGSHSAADWRQIFPVAAPAVVQPPIGSVYWFLDSLLPQTGLPTIGAYTLQDGETGFQEAFADPHLTGPWEVHPGAWTRPPWFANGTVFDQPFIINCIVGLGETEGDFHACLFRGAPYATGDPFTPWTVGTDIITWARVGTGGYSVTSASGNITVSPTVAQATNLPSSFVLTFVPDPTLDSVTLTPIAAIATPNTFYVDSTTFEFTFVDNGGTPHVVTLAGAPGTTEWLGPFLLPYTAFPGGGPTFTADIVALPARVIVEMVAIQLVSHFDTFATGMTWGYRAGQDPSNPSNTTIYGSIGSFYLRNGGSIAEPYAVADLPYGGQDNEGLAGGSILTATLTFGAAGTSGSLNVWFKISLLP